MGLKQSKFEIGFLLVVIAAVVYLYIPHLLGFVGHPTEPKTSAANRAPASTDWLISTQKQGIYDRMTENDQVRVRRAVQYFCAIYWDVDSCLHHMITCGKKCMSYLNPKTQDKVRSAYFKRRTELRQQGGG